MKQPVERRRTPRYPAADVAGYSATDGADEEAAHERPQA